MSTIKKLNYVFDKKSELKKISQITIIKLLVDQSELRVLPASVVLTDERSHLVTR